MPTPPSSAIVSRSGGCSVSCATKATGQSLAARMSGRSAARAAASAFSASSPFLPRLPPLRAVDSAADELVADSRRPAASVPPPPPPAAAAVCAAAAASTGVDADGRRLLRTAWRAERAWGRAPPKGSTRSGGWRRSCSSSGAPSGPYVKSPLVALLDLGQRARRQLVVAFELRRDALRVAVRLADRVGRRRLLLRRRLPAAHAAEVRTPSRRHGRERRPVGAAQQWVARRVRHHAVDGGAQLDDRAAPPLRELLPLRLLRVLGRRRRRLAPRRRRRATTRRAAARRRSRRPRVRLDEEARERRLHLVDQAVDLVQRGVCLQVVLAPVRQPVETRSWMMVSTTSSDEEEK